MKKDGRHFGPAFLAVFVFLITACGGGGSGDGSSTPVTPSGSLDTTFGSTGKVSTDIATHDDLAFGMAIQGDGKIVAAGFSSTGSARVFSLARYDTDGTLDTGFGTGGTVTTPIGSTDDEAFGVAIQEDNKIVVAGYSNNGSAKEIALVRYNTDGTLDTDFGTGGIATTAIGMVNDVAYAVGIQSDGKIVAAGYTATDTTFQFALVRYDTNGTLDTDFGTGGVVTTAVGASDDGILRMVIDPDDRIVAGGFSSDGSSYRFALARYGVDGALDGTFGTGGIVTSEVGTDDYVNALALQSDGKILAAGPSNNGTTNVFALVRYTEAGALDADFGTGGIVTTAIGDDDFVYALAVQSNGKIVAAGATSDNGGSTFAFALARYGTAGTLDTGFGTAGIVTTAIGASDDEVEAVAIDADGKIVAAGYTESSGHYDFAVVRYAP